MKPSNTLDIDVFQVSCDQCGALPYEACRDVKTQEPMTDYHRKRHAEQAKLTKLTTGNTQMARWWRWRIRQVGAPRPTSPHGTHAGYRRHKRDGTKPCKPCAEAAREAWRQAGADKRAKAGAEQ
jgi:hypothetical protein